MLPGTVTLSGYVLECDRIKSAIASRAKTSLPDPANAVCRSCHNLCLTRKYGDKVVQATMDAIDEAAKNGCPSCTLLRDGTALCLKDAPAVEPPPPGWKPSHLSRRESDRRVGYTVGHRKESYSDCDKVINDSFTLGCGLCLTYIYENGSTDILGTILEFELFRKQGQ
jgi:hypothetical protein